MSKEKEVKDEATLLNTDIGSLLKDKVGDNRIVEITPLPRGVNPAGIGILPQAVRKIYLLQDENKQWLLNHTEEELRAYRLLKIVKSNPNDPNDPLVLDSDVLSKMTYAVTGKGAVLHLSNELDLFWSRVIKHPVYNLIAKDGDKEVINGRAFRLNDRTATAKAKDAHHTRKLLLFKKLESMRNQDYQIIACILERDVTRITGSEAYRYVIEYSEQGISQTNEILRLFRNPNNDGDTSLTIEANNVFIFNASKNYNIVTIKGGRYYYRNNVLGSDNDTCIGFLTSPKNNNIFIELQDELTKLLKA